ncbi:hypothetical protein BJV74DRAFT_844847, partial [Russula compacta]
MTSLPAQVMLFYQHVQPLHDLGTSFFNYISFNPQSQLLLLGGFGNLAGKFDIFGRHSLTKISTYAPRRMVFPRPARPCPDCEELYQASCARI